jgi:hypothetical protein
MWRGHGLGQEVGASPAQVFQAAFLVGTYIHLKSDYTRVTQAVSRMNRRPVRSLQMLQRNPEWLPVRGEP